MNKYYNLKQALKSGKYFIDYRGELNGKSIYYIRWGPFYLEFNAFVFTSEKRINRFLRQHKSMAKNLNDFIDLMLVGEENAY